MIQPIQACSPGCRAFGHNHVTLETTVGVNMELRQDGEEYYWYHFPDCNCVECSSLKAESPQS